MRKHSWSETHEILFKGALAALAKSVYARAPRELQKAYMLGWLIDQLARDYPANWELKRTIRNLLDPE